MELIFNKHSSWVIAYIDRDHIATVERDLSKYKRYRNISVYIPTVKILRKQFKGKNIFEEIPLLFNYGFFNIPHKSLDFDFLQKLKDDIPVIHAWVKDPKLVITSYKSKIGQKVEGVKKKQHEYIERKDLITAAIASRGEMERILNAHKILSIYDKKDIDNLREGAVIRLTGYPFDGMDAEVIWVDKKKQKVHVKLGLEGLMKNVTVAFDNVFYTTYHGVFDETQFKEKHIEDIKFKKKGVTPRPDENDND